MAMNRIQFQAGLSMAEFQRQYGTEAQWISSDSARVSTIGRKSPPPLTSDIVAANTSVPSQASVRSVV